MDAGGWARRRVVMNLFRPRGKQSCSLPKRCPLAKKDSLRYRERDNGREEIRCCVQTPYSAARGQFTSQFWQSVVMPSFTSKFRFCKPSHVREPGTDARASVVLVRPHTLRSSITCSDNLMPIMHKATRTAAASASSIRIVVGCR
jgi:hypothetical protein